MAIFGIYFIRMINPRIKKSGARFPFFGVIAAFWAVTVLAFLTGQITGSLYYALTGNIYPGEDVSALQTLVLIGAMGLVIHSFTIVYTIHRSFRARSLVNGAD